MAGVSPGSLNEPNVKRARLVDVARAAGVSTATASFVLSGRRAGRSKPASPETVERIEAAASELGYVPNRFAQAMRRGYTSTVVLGLGSPEDPWAAQVAIEVQRRALPQGFSTLTLVDETWYEFLQGYTPGVAFLTSVDFQQGGLARTLDLVEHGANLVVFSTEAEPDGFDVISSSAVGPTAAAYRRLRARHDEVHFLSIFGSEDRRPGPTRLVGFRGAAAEFGDEPLIHRAGFQRDAIARACRELLESRPTAVICTNGLFAGILRGMALSMGLRVPDDLEIISIGDIPHNEGDYLGPISVYGTPDVFTRIGDIVVHRAVTQRESPFEKHVFQWEFLPGSTTVDGG
ncbi:LacI family DNA-binding transcriptional regulator [Tessaracoccus sp. ZS01]|uniref:LacI family DNA-binding transcriptional regulator n=1 Tax=Tessaracoccus sp. ZS01 TaxID=1906324 RepID=UPI00096F330B|nr:LacI family DNA-binding transcriptional regulator [Tessaracoccus sp. ZS01]MCG6568210.1 LacI family transcriptional regulator [Tessaracoccus sp. ZS01]OMG53453.1 hypothetical protein BJN44_11360 [Tessaracoccus sp. ZS01]